MGAIKNEDFDTEFIDRTLKVIEDYEGDYDITLLLNCLLGLIVLPSEFYKRRKMNSFDADIFEIEELKGLITGIDMFQPMKKAKKAWVPDEKTFRNLIKKVRNGVSHQQITCIERKGKWDKVEIRDFNPSNKYQLEFSVSWTPKQLKEFAIFVAQRYKAEIENIPHKNRQSAQEQQKVYQ